MFNAIKNFLEPPVFEGDEEKTRTARPLQRILIGLWTTPFLLAAVGILVPADAKLLPPVLISLIVLCIALTALERRGYITATSVILTTGFTLIISYLNFLAAGDPRPLMVFFAWNILIAGLLLGGTGALITTLVLLIQEAVLTVLAARGIIQATSLPPTHLSSFIVIAVGLLLILSTFNLASGSIQEALDQVRASEKSLASSNQELKELTQTLEQRVQERTVDLRRSNQTSQERADELQIVADVARAIASIRDLDELLPGITRIICERFGYYHAGIFLLDDKRENAIFRASNSEGGKRMLARGHKLRVEATSIVGYVSAFSRPRVASNVGADTVYFSNPDLPETRAEMALPLILGERLIGVLDIQSKEASAFQEEQIEVLGTLANQVAVAIENASLFGQTREALAESQKTYNQFVARGWASRPQTSIGYQFDKGRITRLTAHRDIQMDEDISRSGLTLPIKIRDQVIGVVSIHSTNGPRHWGDDELAIVRAAVERAALALENSRLLEDAQRRAAKEQKIGEVNAKISASINMRNVLQTAVEELGRAMPGSDVVIRFEQENGNH